MNMGPRTGFIKKINFCQNTTLQLPPFLQHVSIACYAQCCTSYSKAVRPSVCPPRAGIIRKRLQLRSCGLRCRI